MLEELNTKNFLRKFKQKTKMKNLILLITLVGISSCTGLKKLPSNNTRINLTDKNLSAFNGKYEVMTIDSSYRTLDYALLVKSPYDYKNIPSKEDYISMEVISKKKIRVSSFENDQLIHSKILKGKLKNNHFVFRTRFVVPFFFLAINGLSFQKTRIGLLENGNLTMDTAGGGVALLGVFPMGGGDSKHYKHIFRKIK